MRITLDIPDGIICGFFNGVERTSTGLQLVSYQLSSDDFTCHDYGKTWLAYRQKPEEDDHGV